MLYALKPQYALWKAKRKGVFFFLVVAVNLWRHCLCMFDVVLKKKIHRKKVLRYSSYLSSRYNLTVLYIYQKVNFVFKIRLPLKLKSESIGLR